MYCLNYWTVLGLLKFTKTNNKFNQNYNYLYHFSKYLRTTGNVNSCISYKFFLSLVL